MYTGIVQCKAQVKSVKRAGGQLRLTIEVPEPKLLANVAIGASVSINGTCLTVTEFDLSTASFDVIDETLELTNLGNLHEGDAVNFERSAKMGDEIGGHLMSGHVSGLAEVLAVENNDANVHIRFKVPSDLSKYILDKGYVGLDGASLTVGQKEGNEFSVHLIPETLRLTQLGERQVGDQVNLEIDPQTQAIVATVERVMSASMP